MEPHAATGNFGKALFVFAVVIVVYLLLLAVLTLVFSDLPPGRLQARFGSSVMEQGFCGRGTIPRG